MLTHERRAKACILGTRPCFVNRMADGPRVEPTINFTAQGSMRRLRKKLADSECVLRAGKQNACVHLQRSHEGVGAKVDRVHVRGCGQDIEGIGGGRNRVGQRRRHGVNALRAFVTFCSSRSNIVTDPHARQYCKSSTAVHARVSPQNLTAGSVTRARADEESKSSFARAPAEAAAVSLLWL